MRLSKLPVRPVAVEFSGRTFHRRSLYRADRLPVRPATEIATLYRLEGDRVTETGVAREKPSRTDRSTFAAACNSTDQLADYAFNPNQP